MSLIKEQPRSMKRNHLCRGFLLLFCLLLITPPIKASANAAQQPSQIALSIVNQSDRTICKVHIVPTLANDWGADQLVDDTIAPKAMYQFLVAPGNYHMLLADCDANILTIKRDLTINLNYEFTLMQVDISRSACDVYNQQGKQADKQGQYAEAVIAFQEALTCYQAVNDQENVGVILNNIGNVYQYQSRYTEALLSFEQMLVIMQQIGNRRGEGIALANISGIYQDQSRYQKALDTFSQALAIIREVGDRQGEGVILNNIGLSYIDQEQYVEALENLKPALLIVQEIGDRTSEGTILNNIGEVHRKQEDYDGALENYQIALLIAKETDNYIEIPKTLNNIALVYQAQKRYDEALATFEQTLMIKRSIGNRASEAVTLDNIAELYSILLRYTEALSHYQAALVIWRDLNKHFEEGKTLKNIGEVYFNLDQYNDALKNFQAAVVIAREVHDRDGEGASLHGIANVYDLQGRYADALVVYQMALEIAREVGDRSDEGSTLNGMGLVYYGQGRYVEAIENIKVALKIARETGDQVGEGVALNSLGLVYDNQGQHTEALDHYQASLKIRRAIDDREGEGITLNNIGAVYRAKGAYAEALDYYQAALGLARHLGNRSGEGQTLNSIGLVYHNQGLYVEALEFHQAAFEIAHEVGDYVGERTALNNIATVYITDGKYTEALAQFELALTMAHEIGDQAGERTALNNIGSVYVFQGKYIEALARFETALAIAHEIRDQEGEGTSLNNIGAIYVAQGRHADALEIYETGLAIARETGDRTSEGDILGNIGGIYARLEQYEDALTLYQQAITIYDDMRASAGNDRARSAFIDQYMPLYNQSLRLLLIQNQIPDAFLISERGRARAFLDALVTGQVELPDNIAAESLAYENQAYAIRQSTHIALIKAKSMNPSDPALVANLEAQLTVAEADYTVAISAIQSRQSQLTDLVPSRNNNVLSLAAVQNQLDEQTTLISYWMLGDKTVAFLITAKGFDLVELPNATSNNIATTVISFYQRLNPENPHPRPLRNLYKWLVAPLADHLHTRHVAIIPHQWLHYVPFAALTDGQYYFGEQYLLTQLPSASVLPFLNQNAARAEQNGESRAVVFGNPVTESSALPYAEAEAVDVADFLGTSVYTGTAASELQLRTVVSGTSVVHLAAHGNYNTANALYSAIALAVDDEETYDGLLETHEIFGLPLQGNDLVVLSACQTNVGAISRGDEVVGLTRAFFFAGSPTVISSLWNVNDSATGALMKAFYQHWMGEEMSKVEALQAAQADVRTDPRWASPFYWAGFVLNGDGGERSATKSRE